MKQGDVDFHVFKGTGRLHLEPCTESRRAGPGVVCCLQI
jgi:hypothetical protein